LPLWEGFDEPFHFGYVQHLAITRRLPQLGKTALSNEVWESVRLAPASHVIRFNIPAVMTFDEFYRLLPSEQFERMQAVSQVNPQLRDEVSKEMNYQAHHPPLAYALLAPFEWLFSGMPIPKRVFVLRCVGGIASVALTMLGAVWLASEIGLRRIWVEALLLCTFCSQMYYATIAHVANDWLAAPLFTAWLAVACRYLRIRGLRDAAILGGVTAAALLTKAYFLLLLPLLAVSVGFKRPAAVCAALVLAASPWYWRNLQLYGNVSGTVEATNGVGVPQVLAAASAVPWAISIPYMARASVWTGNNSFTNFSTKTINAYLVLIAGLFALYCFRSERKRDVFVLASVAVFIMAIAYATIASYVFTNGRSAGASPWYMQPMLVPVLSLCLLGAQASGIAGKCLTAALLAMSVYMLGATYAAKLIPMYMGFSGGKVTLSSLASWYMEGGKTGMSLSIMPVSFVAPIAAAVVLTAAGLGIAICRRLLKDTDVS
jgi:hypothetical protein